MKSIKRIMIKLVVFFLISYVAICALLYLFQEKVIFFPQKLSDSYKFEYNQTFDEITIPVSEDASIHGLLFKSDHSKGLIFYLHGNAGSLANWGNVAPTYIKLNYDVFILDYRGYGKSSGKIISQEQLLQDNQKVYEKLLKQYPENKTIILGYSIGSGMAAKLASENNPKRLILQAPYYSLKDMMRHTYPIIPTFLLKYKFATNEYLEKCNAPITIFHGTEDKVIYYGSSEKLKNNFPKKINLIKLSGQGHNEMTDNKEYKKEIERVLSH